MIKIRIKLSKQIIKLLKNNQDIKNIISKNNIIKSYKNNLFNKLKQKIEILLINES